MYFLFVCLFSKFYNIVLVSAMQQLKSATIISISPPSWVSLPSPYPNPLG